MLYIRISVAVTLVIGRPSDRTLLASRVGPVQQARRAPFYAWPPLRHPSATATSTIPVAWTCAACRGHLHPPVAPLPRPMSPMSSAPVISVPLHGIDLRIDEASFAQTTSRLVLHVLQVYVLNVSAILMYASFYSKCFIYFRRMLQVFYLDVA